MTKKSWYTIKNFLFFDTYGSLAVSFFLICVFSGIFLAIPFDVHNPYKSLGTLLISNPWGVFIRNTHFWSAQFFLITTILHSWEYLSKDEPLFLTKGKWFRLTLSLLFVFWVMLSGFILKADNDSLQAKQILHTLLSSIPLAGKELSASVLGSENNFQLVYLHHVATTTLFLFIIIFEHSRIIWGQLRTFLITLVLVTILAYIFQAPLHNNLDLMVKGPWYFVGLQEILHWMSRPLFSLIVIFLFLFLIYFIPFMGLSKRKMLKKTLLFSFYFYVFLTVVGYFFRGENWQWIFPWNQGYNKSVFTPLKPTFLHSSFPIDSFKNHPIPEVMNRKESCLICHGKMKGFSPAHNPLALGCVSCHGGNSFSSNKEQAHVGMTLIPGNLDDANRSCGTTNCHPDIPQRVNQSIMSTMSGMITVDRFVFGETDSLNQLSNVHGLKQSAADNHFRDLCAACHLGNQKAELGPITELSRGGGCNACHLNFSDSAHLSLINYLSSNNKKKDLPLFHPSLSIQITDDHCFGCHSRSGRISTNYEGWHETLMDENEVLGVKEFRVLQDHRVFRSMPDDIHHAKGLECIDCHFSYELMGEGKTYYHKEDQVKILCEDCHFSHAPKTIQRDQLDQESLKLLELRKDTLKNKRFLVTGKSGHALVNTFVKGQDSVFLVGKNSGKIFPLKSPADICVRGKAHTKVSCSSCHTAWAPRCIGCHNTYEPSTPGIDLYTNKITPGSWIEYTGEYLATPPTLGIYTDTTHGVKKEIIKTAVPGMVLSMDKSNYTNHKGPDQNLFHRLFAPAEAHTIQKEGRSCVSCHNNPVALGYGEGKLTFNPASRKWLFIPKYQSNVNDGLPEDAWIDFLTEPTGSLATRTNFRPFTLVEQKKILTVGTCLTCHNGNSRLMLRGLDNFKELITQKRSSCLAPLW